MIRQAVKDDIVSIEKFIGQAGLSSAGIKENIDHFLLTENNEGKLIAVIGIEPLNEVGLLRSLAFSPAFHSRNLPALLEQVFILAREKELRTLYLAAIKKESITLFEMLGFQTVSRESISRHLQLSTHGKHLMGITNCKLMCKFL